MPLDKDWLSSGLPVYDGNKDRTMARKEIDLLGGANQIRRRIVENANGSQTIIHLKGDMPPQIRTMPGPSMEDEKPDTLKRGYVANLKSAGLELAGKVVAWLLRRSPWSGLATTKLFGAYSVFKLASAEPDVVFAGTNKLTVYSGSEPNVAARNITGIYPEGIPIIRIAPEGSGAYYDAGWGVFLVGTDGLKQVTAGSSPVITTLYKTSDDLFNSGWAAIAASEAVSGVVYNVAQDMVAFNRMYVSLAGHILQRMRRIKLGRNTPYFTQDAWSDVEIVAPYLYPNGTAAISSSGGWAADKPSYDLDVFYTVVRSGSPPTGVWAMGNVYQSAGEWYKYSDGTDSCTTHKSTINKTEPWSLTSEIGWFGKSVSVTISMSTGHNYEMNQSAGNVFKTSPVYVGPSYKDTLSSPPSIVAGSGNFYLPHPTQSGESSQVNPGDPYGTAYSGNATTTTWNSPTICTATVDNETVCSINVNIHQRTSSHELQIAQSERGYETVAGTVCSFVDPPGLPAWNTIEYAYQFDLAESHPNMSWSEGTEDSGRLFTASMSTRDYLLYDVASETYIYIQGTFVSSGKLDMTSGSSSVSMEFVIQRGEKTYTRPIHSYSGGPFSIFWDNSGYGLPFHPAKQPFAGFAPPYCCQGAFKYAAYSEKADSGADEMLLSLPLQIKFDDFDTVQQFAEAFTPTQFAGIVGSYCSIPDAQHWKSAMHNVVHKINFVDGAFSEWPGTIDPQNFADYAEVYRT